MRIFLIAVISSIILFGCEKKSEDDYLNSAKESIKNNNIPEAIISYEALVEEYPESKEAPEALFLLARIYQNKMIKNLSDKESLEKAAQIYKEIYDKYPQSERAPLSLFMSGFIQANDLKDYTKATSLYNLFLEKYPGHEWASQAKVELDNMGLSPDEILKKPKPELDAKR
jgi:TolA-binding protein